MKQGSVSPTRGHPIKTSPLISQLRTTSGTNGISDESGQPGKELHFLNGVGQLSDYGAETVGGQVGTANSRVQKQIGGPSSKTNHNNSSTNKDLNMSQTRTTTFTSN